MKIRIKNISLFLIFFFSAFAANAALYVKTPSPRNQLKIDSSVKAAVALLKSALLAQPKVGTRAYAYKEKYKSFWAEYLQNIESVNFVEALEPEKDCTHAVAYAAEDFNQITLCPGFYSYGNQFMIDTLLHEMGHMTNISSASPGIAGVEDEECLAEQAAYGVMLLNGKGSSYTFTYECQR